MIRLYGLTLLAGFLISVASAQEPPKAPPEPELGQVETAQAHQALARFLRDQLLKNLPEPLAHNQRNWNHQKDVIVGVKWQRLKPIPLRSLRNDGLWHQLTVQALEPQKTLHLGIIDVKSTEPGRTTFVAMTGLNVRLTAEQQLWKSGVRLYGGQTQARCRAAVRLECELTNRLDRQPGQLIPDALIRVRVTKAEVFYQDLVVERTAGLEGDQARRVGEIAQNVVKLLKPDLERDLLAKANAAILKAGEAKEIRVEFQKLLGLNP